MAVIDAAPRLLTAMRPAPVFPATLLRGELIRGVLCETMTQQDERTNGLS